MKIVWLQRCRVFLLPCKWHLLETKENKQSSPGINMRRFLGTTRYGTQMLKEIRRIRILRCQRKKSEKKTVTGVQHDGEMRFGQPVPASTVSLETASQGSFSTRSRDIEDFPQWKPGNNRGSFRESSPSWNRCLSESVPAKVEHTPDFLQPVEPHIPPLSFYVSLMCPHRITFLEEKDDLRFFCKETSERSTIL